MALHESAKNGNLSQAEKALGNNEAINGLDEGQETALHKAARAGHVELVSFLISKGAEIKVKDKYGRTALYQAAWNGHTAISEKLLIKDGDIVDFRCVCGMTALSKAAENGHIEVVKLLLKYRASPTEENIHGEDVMMLARRNGHEDVTDLLISYAIPNENDIIDDCLENFQNFVQEKNFEGLFDQKTVNEMAKNAASRMLALQKMGWEEGFALELALLTFFDIVVLADNSATVKVKEKGTRRSQIEKTLETIARMFTLMTDRKITTVTLMNRDKSWDNVDTKDVPRIMNEQNFGGESRTDKALQDKVISSFKEEDDMPRPVLVLTLSDFKSSKAGGSERLKQVISNYLSHLRCPTMAAFQFVQVGNEAHHFFKELMGCAGVGKSQVYPVGGLDFDSITRDIESNERREIMKDIMIGSIVDAYYNRGTEAEDENLREREEQRRQREEKERKRQEQILKDKADRLEAKAAEMLEEEKRKEKEFVEQERKRYEENSCLDYWRSYDCSIPSLKGTKQAEKEIRERQRQLGELRREWFELRTYGYERPADWYRALEVINAARYLGLLMVVDEVLGKWDKDILLNAASQGWIGAVQFLLNRKMDVNLHGKKGRTALHLAARHGHGHVVRILLEKGAKPMLEDKNGNTPLDLAQKHRQYEASVLLESWTL